ncbi:hypothetical protein RM553_06450 [Zunongwangia sp. F363]|uniref:Outer membrane protein beta-barrel domain-containing protein n=1 Tax=Autumnicola tepida TaxID=3075595 RepID=A0ABU3C7Z9_9FLAO|nr:hypothetical protein [Zunongwangia sp. F363]MDT0642469.1 hypothetical protein [Zunongwangia sp. F363]
MRSFIIIFIALISFNFSHAQSPSSVEKSLTGIQTGLLGVWGYNEQRLGTEWTFRTEVGLDAGIFSSYYSDRGVDFLLVPVITVEPRWYYNMNKRADKAKKTFNNAANFLSLETTYHPDWFVLTTNGDDIRIINQISFIPKWGIKRNLGRHFNYEAGVGLGYLWYLEEVWGDQGEALFNLHLRIGYNF